MNNLNDNKIMGNIVESNNGEIKNIINKSNQNNINKTKTIIKNPNPYNISLIDILDIAFTVLDKYIR